MPNVRLILLRIIGLQKLWMPLEVQHMGWRHWSLFAFQNSVLALKGRRLLQGFH